MNNSELREIDCKIDLLAHVDSMAEDGRIDHSSADRIKMAIRYYNGNALFTLYLLWVKKFKRQKDVAAKLNISVQRVSKIVRDDLAGLRAALIFSASQVDGHSIEHDPWVYARDVIYEDPESEDAVYQSDSPQIGSVIENVAKFNRDGRNRILSVGQTNPKVEPDRRHPDDIAAEAIRQFRAERRLEDRIRKKMAQKNEEISYK
jgi:transcriptional regulator with XRE-family HTH domain